MKKKSIPIEQIQCQDQDFKSAQIHTHTHAHTHRYTNTHTHTCYERHRGGGQRYIRTDGIEWIRRVKQEEKRHKAVYTIASVAYGWAGAVMRFR